MTVYNVVQLDLDTSGTNPNNLIQDEPHTLSNRPVRSIAPNLGPFFAKSLIIMDGAKQLVRGINYQIVELEQEATLLYGQEISTVILITDTTVSDNVTITYQALGGHFAHSDVSIANLFQSLINDNRNVAWENIFNKPTEYPPTIHRHLLDDVYGFEPIVDVLERIKRAITLGQVSVVLEIVNQLLTDFNCENPVRAVPSSNIVTYDAFLYLLSKRKMLSPLTVDVVNCHNRKGYMLFFTIDTRDYPVGKTIYWEFFKPSGNVTLLSPKSGSVVADGTIQNLGVYIPTDTNAYEYPLYLGLKADPADTEFLAVSYKIQIDEAYTTTDPYLAFVYGRYIDSKEIAFIGNYTDPTDIAEVSLFFNMTRG